MYEYPPYDFPWLVIIGTVLFQIFLNGLAAWWLLRKSHKPEVLDPALWSLLGFGTLYVVSSVHLSLQADDMRHPQQPFVAMMIGQLVFNLIGIVLTILRLRASSSRVGYGALVGVFSFCLFFVCCLLPTHTHQPEGHRRTQCKNNLKVIGLSFHNHYDAFGTFPHPQSGESPHSWRIEILPYIDHEHEFNQYDQTAAWDSVQNAPIAQTVVQSLTCPSQYPRNSYPPGQPVQTAYTIPIYPQGIYPGGDPLSLKSISDGTSNTLLVVEACGQNIIWTEPRDVVVTKEMFGVNLPSDQLGSSPGLLSSHHFNGAQALLADGSVRFVSNETDPAILELLTNANDGEVIGEW